MYDGATVSSILSNGRRSRATMERAPTAEIACPLALRDDETPSIPAGRAARSAGRQAGRRRVMSRAPGTNRAASRRKRTAHEGKDRALMAQVVSMKQLLESGVHFGHQTRRW